MTTTRKHLLLLLCNNEALTQETLRIVLDAAPQAASTADHDGCLPIHFLVLTHPEAGELWQLLIERGPKDAPEPNLNPNLCAAPGGLERTTSSMLGQPSS